MKIRRIEVIKTKLEYKTANQIIFGCMVVVEKNGGPVITETVFEFAKTNLRLANVQKQSFSLNCFLKF